MASSAKVIRTSCFAIAEIPALRIRSAFNMLDVPTVAAVFYFLAGSTLDEGIACWKKHSCKYTNLILLIYDSVPHVVLDPFSHVHGHLLSVLTNDN